MDHHSDDDDFGVVTTLGVRLWGLLLALAIGTAFVVAVVRPYLNDLDTQGTRRTHDYITSQQTALRQLAAGYAQTSVRIVQTPPGPERDALLQQRAAVREQMRAIADLIPRNVPADIAGYLGEYP